MTAVSNLSRKIGQLLVYWSTTGDSYSGATVQIRELLYLFAVGGKNSLSSSHKAFFFLPHSSSRTLSREISGNLLTPVRPVLLFRRRRRRTRRDLWFKCGFASKFKKMAVGEDVSPEDRVKLLLEEGPRKACDDSCENFKRNKFPDFYDEEKFKR